MAEQNTTNIARQGVSHEELCERMQEIEHIFGAISDSADSHIKTTCPYRDAAQRCTAKFECRFVARNRPHKGRCGWDGSDDYQLGWFPPQPAIEKPI
jgi:hypothetical protein